MRGGGDEQTSTFYFMTFVILLKFLSEGGTLILENMFGFYYRMIDQTLPLEIIVEYRVLNLGKKLLKICRQTYIVERFHP